jgi:CRISPR-associated protein Csd1
MSILASLYALSEQMSACENAMPKGYVPQNVQGEIVLSPEGDLVDICSFVIEVGKHKTFPRMPLPTVVTSRSMGIAPQFMWDQTAYVLGVAAKKNGTKIEKDDDGNQVPDFEGRIERTHAAFVEAMNARLGESDDPDLQAVLTFLNNWQPQTYVDSGYDLSLLNCNVVFRIDGQADYLHNHSEVMAMMAEGETLDDEGSFPCLVTGRMTQPARTHPMIKGVHGAQSSGAALISFNKDSFCSHGRTQGLNAPIAPDVSKAISNTLNHMLRLNRAGPGRRSIRIGEMTLVFWLTTPQNADNSDMDDMAAWLFDGRTGDTDEGGDEVDGIDVPDEVDENGKLSRMFNTFRQGAIDELNIHPSARIHVLGLLPNAARLSVRYWSESSLPEFMSNFSTFHSDLEVVNGYPPAWNTIRSIAAETVRKRKYDDINPSLPEALMRCVQGGSKFPNTLIQKVLRRIRIERSKNPTGHVVSPRQAAIMKAYLIRNEKENMSVALDTDNSNMGYLLGRAMCIHERVQLKANPRSNRTVVDRFMSSAMSTPARVFPAMSRGTQHGLTKLRRKKEFGLVTWLERDLAEIMGRIDGDIPVRLALADQARFALGYYHKKQHRNARVEDCEKTTSNSKD